MDTLESLPKECINLLKKNKLIKPLIKSEFVNNKLSEIKIENSLEIKITNEFKERLGIKNDDQLNQFLIKNKINENELINSALYDIRMKKFSFENFGHKVESHFIERKPYLDIVVYSLIRVSDQFKAIEFFQRILEKEEDFGDLAYKYSEGIEKKTRGILGPIPLGQCHPKLGKVLSSSKIGHVQPPIPIENFFIITRLETLDSAQLDDYMREKMAIELFNQWIEKEVDTLHTNFLNESILNLESGKES